MQPDHTATEFAQAQPLLVTPLDGVVGTVPRPRAGALTRVTFCFAWLFGLEPFLSNGAEDSPIPRLDRH
ncbi:hypothetical protein AAGS40_23800 [Paraburkholderia sp. PREW-6R]|uniref:hypothetical protein n=1 Tax=Paraburkholderia sp. PREW-6R TaxID=3141544 RepID=UPI0031F4F780